MRADGRAAQESEDTLAEGSTDETTTPVVSAGAAGGTAGEPSVTADAASAAVADRQVADDAAAERSGLVMQPTTLNAGRASIYGTGGQAVATGNAYATQTAGANASVNSLYAGTGAAQTADQAGRLPVEDMPPVGSTGQQPLAVPGDEQAEITLPENGPIPKTARTALTAEAATGNAADLVLATPADDGAAAVLPGTTGQASATDIKKDEPRKTMTLASLFANKREARQQFDGNRFAEGPRRVLNRESASATRKASLGTLPGVSMASSMFSTDHSEADEVEDDGPQFKEVASLAGLARLAPNGLWLQTEKVRTGCFKPELLQVLKTIEKHYDKPIIVTSGLRDIKVNRAKQSLHTRCAAADIQISGVSKWELAEYLRSMPGRGGVGTYCHTESVHIDIGPERDWNWRCRRRK